MKRNYNEESQEEERCTYTQNQSCSISRVSILNRKEVRDRNSERDLDRDRDLVQDPTRTHYSVFKEETELRTCFNISAPNKETPHRCFKLKMHFYRISHTLSHTYMRNKAPYTHSRVCLFVFIIKLYLFTTKKHCYTN